MDAQAPGRVSGDAAWAAVLARDQNSDGLFVYSVVTTGIYCRPSCPARRANRSNVRFHAHWLDAEACGFRACKRCRPNEVSKTGRWASLVAAACRSLESSEDEPSLQDLADAASLSAHHFHRVFKSLTGVTPKAYAAAVRRQRARSSLKDSRTVTEALHDAGFGSSSRFYAASANNLGMTPSEFRAGGSTAWMRYASSTCSLGSILVAGTEKGVSAILLGDNPAALVRELGDIFPRARLTCGDRDFERLVARVVALIEQPRNGDDLPLDIQGTAFQQRVWSALRGLRAGETASYAEIARRIGAPKAVRAVAGACAANKLAVAIPCHRVVRSDGSLSGYRWGIARKRALLAREKKQ
jgi:AraC family transcriptional regulator, regulatory protein of adaptative response / methylated-DNA-[protein]-cysteine methyltransferase